MNDSAGHTKLAKQFSLEEANAMLPLVRSIAIDISEIFSQVTSRRSDIHRLMRSGGTSGSVYKDEMAESRSDLQAEYDRIFMYREELESLGVFLRHSESGEIEFPTTIEGRDAFLSWRIGEVEIAFWRFADAPSGSRKQIRMDSSH